MLVPAFEFVPLEIGKKYKTKFQTGEMVTLIDIIYHKEKITGLKVIYESKPELGICPLGADRLIQERLKVGEVDVCPHCGELLEEDHV